MIRIASALIVYNHKLLLHLRDSKHPDPNLRNKWGLVGGGVNNIEDPQIAVRREIKEESNLEPAHINYLGKLEIEKPDGIVEAHLFCSQLSNEEVKQLKLGNEGADVKFFTVDEAKNLSLSPEVDKYYKKYHKEIENYIEKGILPKINDF